MADSQLHTTRLRRWTCTAAVVATVAAFAGCGDGDSLRRAPASTASASEQEAATPRTAVSSGEGPATNLTEGCVESYDPEVDYFPDKTSVEEATDFEIRYANHYKVLTVRTDLRHRGMAPQVVVMVQCGTPTPDLTGALAGATVLEVPARTFGLNRNDDLASAVALGLADNLVTHGFGRVFPEEVDERLRAGEIAVSGGAFGAQNIDFETVASTRPDVMLLLLHSEAAMAGVARLAELGIPTVPTLTSGATTVLGRAEWTKVIALPFNHEARANKLLGDVLDAYRDLREQARAQEEKPTAIFAQCGTNGACTVARNGWQAQILEDAGLVNVIADPTAPLGVEPMAIEQVFESGADADWLVAFSWPGEKYTGPLMPFFRAYRENQIISNDAEGVSVRNGAHEYFYSAALRPDLLLKDLVAQVHPHLVPNHVVTYLGISPYPQGDGQP